MSVSGDSPSASSPGDTAADAEPPERTSERLVVTIVREDGDWSVFGVLDDAIRETAAAVARHPHNRLGQVSEACIVLGSDALVRRLNRTYRGKDAATNVLSFPYQPPPAAALEHAGESTYLGDVVLAAETVAAEARARVIEPLAHVQHLVLHGLLHLVGFDHGTEAEARAMEGLETEILASLGVADPYAELAS